MGVSPMAAMAKQLNGFFNRKSLELNLINSVGLGSSSQYLATRRLSISICMFLRVAVLAIYSDACACLVGPRHTLGHQYVRFLAMTDAPGSFPKNNFETNFRFIKLCSH